MKSTRFLYRFYGVPKTHRFAALYGIFRKDLSTGKIEGLCENSFSMSWTTDRVCIWSHKYALEWLNKHGRDKQYKFFLYRLTRRGKSATILADFEERKQDHLQSPKGISKYNYRNIKWRIGQNRAN